MKLSIKTTTLQDMVGRAAKGVGNEQLFPITTMIALEVKENVLSIITSTGSNTLCIKHNVNAEDFYVVVTADQFIKLISKLTCDEVELEVTDAGLKVTGNGSYVIDIPLDEDGSTIKYPNPFESLNLEKEKAYQMNKTTIETILKSVKPALLESSGHESSCYINYFVGDRIIASDGALINSIAVSMFDGSDRDVLISPALMNLLDVIDSEKVEGYMLEDNVVFHTPDCDIYGRFVEGVDSFNADKFVTLIDEKFKSSCAFNKAGLLSALDRMSLFVSPYDEKTVRFTFTKTGLNIENLKSSSIESVPYSDSKKFKEFTCFIAADCLSEQLKASASDVIHMEYGNENTIKLTDGNITQLVALSDITE